MKMAYVDLKVTASTLELIETCNRVLDDYSARGYQVTLRQLYYQLVAHHGYPNNPKAYKRLGSRISDARDAGLVDWSAIVDLTRSVKKRNTWDEPMDILNQAYNQFMIDMWANQEWRPEVWYEKEALKGVIEPVCQRLHVPSFACKGYPSASSVWDAGHNRFIDHLNGVNHVVGGQSQYPCIIHLGDHDPSGIDMTRDLADRLARYTREEVSISRVALNMDQVEEHRLPPFPAKLKDSRGGVYISEYGRSSWELDALDPATLTAIIENEVATMRDEARWAVRQAEFEEQKQELWDRIHSTGGDDHE